MAEIILEREFKTDAQTLWRHITNVETLPQWFGKHSGFCLIEADMNLSQTGPWTAKMGNTEGREMQLAGDILTSSNLELTMTWAWVQEDGSLGEQTLVEMSARAISENRASWKIKHSGFAQTPVADRHKIGWTAAQENMEGILSSIKPTSSNHQS